MDVAEMRLDELVEGLGPCSRPCAYALHCGIYAAAAAAVTAAPRAAHGSRHQPVYVPRLASATRPSAALGVEPGERARGAEVTGRPLAQRRARPVRLAPSAHVEAEPPAEVGPLAHAARRRPGSGPNCGASISSTVSLRQQRTAAARVAAREQAREERAVGARAREAAALRRRVAAELLGVEQLALAVAPRLPHARGARARRPRCSPSEASMRERREHGLGEVGGAGHARGGLEQARGLHVAGVRVPALRPGRIAGRLLPARGRPRAGPRSARAGGAA